MGKSAHFHPRIAKNEVISDVAELIVQATGDSSESLENPSSITLADLQTIKRALESALKPYSAAHMQPRTPDARRPPMKEVSTPKPTNDHEALDALVKIIVAKNYSVSVNDGGDWPIKRSTDVAAICEAASAVDMAMLRLRNAENKTVGLIELVFGNAPDELISDHSANAEMDAIVNVFQLCFAET